MVKILEVKQTINNDNVVEDMYDIELLIKYIIRYIEQTREINNDDNKYISIILAKVKTALKKVSEILKVK